MENKNIYPRLFVFTLICFLSSQGLVYGRSYKALVGTHFSNLEKSLKDSLVHCSYAYHNKEEVDVFVLDRGAMKDDYKIIEFQMRIYVLNDIISRVSIVDFTFKKTLNESLLYHEVKDMHKYYNDTSFYDGESVAFVKESLFVKTKLMPSEFIQDSYDWVALSYGIKDSFDYKNKDGSNVLDYGFIGVDNLQLVDKSPLNLVVLKIESFNSEVNRIKIQISNDTNGFLLFVLDKNFYDSDNNYHIVGERGFSQLSQFGFGKIEYVFVGNKEIKEMWICIDKKVKSLPIKYVHASNKFSGYCFSTVRKQETNLSLIK